MKNKKFILPLFIISALFLVNAALFAGDADGLFEDGTAMLKQGKYKDAVDLLERFVRDNPGNIGASCNLAVAYAFRQDIDRAIVTLENVIEKEPLPGRGILFYNLGSLYNLKGDTFTSEQKYRKSLAILPYFAHVYGVLSRMSWDGLRGQGFYTQANTLDDYIADIRSPEAQEVIRGPLVYNTAERMYPTFYLYGSPAWHIVLAIHHMYANEIEKARAEIDQVFLTLDENSPLESDRYAFVEAFVYTGKTYLREKKYAKALEEFQAAYKANPNHLSAIAHIGYTYYLLGDYKSAEKFHRMATKIDPDYPVVVNLKEALDSVKSLP